MATHFQLSQNGERVHLFTVDEDLCKMLGVPVDADQWAFNWHNGIGYYLSTGRTWDQIREIIESNRTESARMTHNIENPENLVAMGEYYDSQQKIVDHLETNYQSTSF